MLAGPRCAGRSRGCARQSAQGDLFVAVIDIQLRPGLHHGQIAEGPGQVLIAQFALNPGAQQHIAGVSHLQQRCGSENSLHRPARVPRVMLNAATSRMP